MGSLPKQIVQLNPPPERSPEETGSKLRTSTLIMNGQPLESRLNNQHLKAEMKCECEKSNGFEMREGSKQNKTRMVRMIYKGSKRRSRRRKNSAVRQSLNESKKWKMRGKGSWRHREKGKWRQKGKRKL